MPEPAVARRFGDYTLVAKLATGGMAEIFLARLRGAGGFEKLVCIKRILPSLAKDPQFVDMFLSEAKIVAQISHSNVCQVFQLGALEHQYYIAMEYLEGVPFSCFRRRDLYAGHPDARLVAGLGVQAAEGLHHAHQLKGSDGALLDVVHRDVSVNNLFVTVDGIVKVLDFGIAKAYQTSTIKTSSGSMKGTHAYMAPEQLRGERLDRRTDVFALGIVLWELLAQEHLFRRDTDYLTFQAITTDPVVDIRTLRPDIPAALAAVIMKALSRDREGRFPTARAFGDALTKSVHPLGGPLTAPELGQEIEGAFWERLREQRALIKIGRDGGNLDLETDLGPGLGRASELKATHPARSDTDVVKPLRMRRSRRYLGWLAIAVFAAAAMIAIGVIIKARRHAADEPGDTPLVAMTVTPSDAAVVGDATDIAVDAAIDAAVDAAPPGDAAIPIDAGTRIAHPIAHPPPPREPGTITIDSVPVYATIFIDGKQLGATPIVRLSLPAGRHVIRAESATGGVKTATVVIEPGKVAPAKRFEW